MAKISGITSKISGKVGELVFTQRKSGTVVYEASSRKTPVRSERQMSLRTQWANLAAVFKLFDGTLKRGYESLPSGMSVYNAFVQANSGMVKVYITKTMCKNGGCVLAPYQITQGSLPSIYISKNGSSILVTNLSVGSLTIGAETTVAQLSEAIINNNTGWAEGDQLTFFLGSQTVDPVTSVPRATLSSNKVVLDLEDTTPLWNVVDSAGFNSVGGYLGMATALSEGAAAWVHSREATDGQLKVSTQFLFVESTILATYQTASAMAASTNSYGGINTGMVYLKPNGNSETGTTGSAGTSESGSGSNSGDSGDTGGSSDSGDTGGSGGSSGSGETGEN